MKKLLIALSLIVPMTALAGENLPFVGKKEFGSFCFGGNGHTHYIEVKSNSDTKIYMVSRKTGEVEYVLYQGKYRKIIPDGAGGYFKVINAKKIALTDSQGNIDYSTCGSDAVMKLY